MIDVRPTVLDGVLEILPVKHHDDRGFFSETYNAARFHAAGIDTTFVQDNHSYSQTRGVLRGLHYQTAPHAQDKLIRVVRGAIFDVAVDIRRSSPNFGKWVGVEISAEKWNQLLVPKGFAHGFLTLVADTEVVYKVSDVYSRVDDRAVRYDDPAIGIDWPALGSDYLLSSKDMDAPLMDNADLFD
jgi:dTDP-4-dehydrorhamnose 3,5-epimerase